MGDYEKCQYVWRTTSKKGQPCGRRIFKKDGNGFCFQHKAKTRAVKETEPSESTPIPEVSPKPTKFTQLENSKGKAKVITKKPNKKIVLSSSSSFSSSSSSSSSSDSSTLSSS